MHQISLTRYHIDVVKDGMYRKLININAYEQILKRFQQIVE